MCFLEKLLISEIIAQLLIASIVVCSSPYKGYTLSAETGLIVIDARLKALKDKASLNVFILINDEPGNVLLIS